MKPNQTEGSTGVEKRTDAEKILDELEMTDDGYIHYSTILPIFEKSLAALKELIPIAERMQAMCAKRGEGNADYRRDAIEYKSAIERAKTILENTK